MSQNIYILSDPRYKVVTNLIRNQIFDNGVFESEDLILTESILLDMAKSCKVEYFYVIAPDKEILFPNFDFTFKPPYWDSIYLHIWNNDPKVRLFNTQEVLKNPLLFTDESLHSGKIPLKNIPKKIFEESIE